MEKGGEMKKAVLMGLMGILGYVSVNAATLRGTVTDSQTDEPLAGVTLLLRTGGGGGGGDTVAQITTSADGGYVFDNLEVRRYNIIAVLDGYLPGNESVRIWRDNDNIIRDIALVESDNSGTITGTVTDASSDEPLSGAEVILLQSDGQGTGLVPVDTTTTNQEGVYVFSGVMTALTHVVTPVADGYNEASSDNVRVDPEGTATVNLSLTEYVPPSGAIAGTVTDAETDEPLAGAEVVLRIGTWMQGQGIAWEDAATVTTNAEGAYILEALAPSTEQLRYGIVISLPGYNTFSSYNITVGDNTVQVDATLETVTLGNLHVFVADESDDSPLIGASVNAALEIADGTVYSGTTDANGWVSFEDALTGNYTLTVSLDGYVTETQGRSLEENENDSAVILLAPAAAGSGKTLYGTVSDAADNPVTDAEITLQAGGTNNILTMIAITGDDGSYSIPGIPDQYGTVRITVVADGFDEYNTTVPLQGDSTALDIAFATVKTLPNGKLHGNPYKLSFSRDSGTLRIAGNGERVRLTIHTLRGSLIEDRTVSTGDRPIYLKHIHTGALLLVGIQNNGNKYMYKMAIP
jgi:hypothetical protein